MTQTPGSTTPAFNPQPGAAVRRKDSPEIGVVTESDPWWDTFLLRGVDISEQTLVEWRIEGRPIRRWERTRDLEPVLSPPSTEMPVVRGNA